MNDAAQQVKAIRIGRKPGAPPGRCAVWFAIERFQSLKCLMVVGVFVSPGTPQCKTHSAEIEGASSVGMRVRLRLREIMRALPPIVQKMLTLSRFIIINQYVEIRR
jgi:hypothetical protein